MAGWPAMVMKFRLGPNGTVVMCEKSGCPGPRAGGSIVDTRVGVDWEVMVVGSSSVCSFLGRSWMLSKLD